MSPKDFCLWLEDYIDSTWPIPIYPALVREKLKAVHMIEDDTKPPTEFD